MTNIIEELELTIVRLSQGTPSPSPAPTPSAPSPAPPAAPSAPTPVPSLPSSSPTPPRLATSEASSATPSASASVPAVLPSSSAQSEKRSYHVQVVVGHFCRHALRTLADVMSGKPNKDAMEAALRSKIEELWTNWVDGFIEKAVLLDEVLVFVRNSTPEAANVNVLADFKVWYEQQLKQQKELKLQQSHDSRRAVGRNTVTMGSESD